MTAVSTEYVRRLVFAVDHATGQLHATACQHAPAAGTGHGMGREAAEEFTRSYAHLAECACLAAVRATARARVLAGRPVAPSEYDVEARPNRGDVVEVHYANGRPDTLLVIGSPITTGRRGCMARVREVGGRHDGNEFGAYFIHD